MGEFYMEPNNLELMFKYITEYKDRWFNDPDGDMKSFDDWGNKLDPKTELYAYVAALYGYNRFPNIVKDSDFESIQATKIYHGLENHQHGANYLWDPVYHMGKGNFGSGMYFSTDYEDARSFVGGMFKDETKIITAKLSSKNTVKYTTLCKIADHFLDDQLFFHDEVLLSFQMRENFLKLEEFLNHKDNQDYHMDVVGFKMLLSDNPSIIGVLLGADAVLNDDRPEFYCGQHIIILNRNALIVPEKCAKIIFQKSGREYCDAQYTLVSIDDVNNAQM